MRIELGFPEDVLRSVVQLVASTLDNRANIPSLVCMTHLTRSFLYSELQGGHVVVPGR